MMMGRRCTTTTIMSAASSSSSSSSSSTGWINPDTLLFRDATIREYRGTTDGTNAVGGGLGGGGGGGGGGGDDDDDDVVYDGDDNNSDAKVMYPASSPIERLLVRDRLVYVKRDDALHLPGSNVCGNKGRKFLSLDGIPPSDFPDAIVSYGGPQSNAMVALAAIVNSKNNAPPPSSSSSSSSSADVEKEEKEKEKKRFVYYTKTMPRYLRKNPNGNLLRATALGMEMRTLSHDEYAGLFGGLHGGSALAPADLDPPMPGRSLWIPQGGALCAIAKAGCDDLANEIIDYWDAHGRGMPLAVCVPGGTCTTALLLHRSLGAILEERRRRRRVSGGGEVSSSSSLDIRVIVIPCVGDDEYAIRQMISLDRSVGGRGRMEDMPHVLRPRADVEYGSARRRSGGYFTFGEPARAILDAFDEMNESGLYLDLLYGAPAFSLLLQHWTSRSSDCPIAGRQIMYVHSGGLEGIASQLTRYKHKGLIDAGTIQIS